MSGLSVETGQESVAEIGRTILASSEYTLTRHMVITTVIKTYITMTLCP